MADSQNRLNMFALSRGVALGLGACMLAGAAVVDYATTAEISLSAFYLFAILTVTWNCVDAQTGLAIKQVPDHVLLLQPRRRPRRAACRPARASKLAGSRPMAPQNRAPDAARVVKLVDTGDLSSNLSPLEEILEV